MKKVYYKLVTALLSLLFFVYCFPFDIYLYNAHAATIELTGQQISDYCNSRVGQSFASNMCLAFVSQCFVALGASSSSDCCAWNYGNKYCTHSTRNDIPVGADVFFSSDGCQYDVIDGYGHHCGHIGIYVGDGYIVHAYSSKIQKMKIDTVVSHGYKFRGWGIHGNVVIKDVPLTRHLTISGQDPLPSGKLTQGKSFPVQGMVSGYPNINHVWGGVYNLDGTPTAQYLDKKVDTSTYNLATHFDPYIIFNNLSVGYYIYKIEATTTDNQYYKIESKFQIGDPPKPSNVKLSIPKTEFTKGEKIVFTPSGTNVTGGYTIGIDDASGNRLITEHIDIGATYSTSSLDAGNYSAYITAFNEAGLTDSARITFTVKPNTVKITLDGNGGTVSKTSFTASVGSKLDGLSSATATKTGFIFAGWFTEKAGGTQVKASDTASKDMTLFAHWTAKKITVTFYRNINSDDTSKVQESFTYGVANQKFGYSTDGTGHYKKMNDPSIGFGEWTKTGYSFLGWNKDKNANTNQYSGYSGVNNEWINSNSPAIDLYGVWKANAYNVKLVYNDETDKTETVNVTYDGKYTTLPSEPKRTGYHFNGWFTSDGKQITNNDIVKITSDLTLTAHWSKDKIMLTFDAQGGTAEAQTKLLTYESKYGVLPNATRKGYTFDGWYLDKEYKQPITEDTVVKITKNAPVYAKWSLMTVNITFDGNGGASDAKSKNVVYGKTYGVLPTAALDGKVFVGWFTKDGKQITSDMIVESESGFTVYAKWTIIGDVDLNGEVNVADAVCLMKHLICEECFSKNENYFAADVLKDGKVDAKDLTILKRILMKTERNGDTK